ncbi:FecR family protein [Serratia entomophila]|uniref:FecR family protein n=1 Tax=Serratia entomophila TaxID=42906 RepID=UPI00217A78B6|nr:DUF4880 domain-containing protein [Serratia entomophila]CAI0991207.1 fec operon regulator FecR [Serratia entomophila]CAI1869309.1 fec operon regulator FecR [Serratia entomophila]CAI1872663.1 fec operon regulator FecR [Serratia entomophila]CAI1928092.1 fec operon regulator FecR [Serratia entomophila]CAI1959618.1 fec operon regulator FecR [Serratia entomophila]
MSYFEWRAKNLLAREARNWLVHLTSGRATTDDADAFRQWYQKSPQHYAAFNEVKRLWRQLEPAMAATFAPDAGARRDSASVPNWGRRAFLGAAAASAGAFLLKPDFFLNPEVSFQGLTSDYQTATGEQKNILLQGNVSVEMNTLTRIDLRPAGIALKTGEAQIRAQAMSIPQLVVYANGGEVYAKTADFNIRNLDNQVSVTCLAGEVSVMCQATKRGLQAGQQLTYSASGMGPVVQANTEQVIAWQRRLLIFNHQPLYLVIEEINRYRPGKIILLNSQLGQRLVQARFKLDQLETVAALIRDAYGARVTNLPGGIVVLS